MAISPDKIADRYREELDKLLVILEPKLDEYLLRRYHDLGNFGYIKVRDTTMNELFGCNIPPHLNKFLLAELNLIYTDWTVQRTNSNVYLFHPPKNLLFSITQKNHKKKTKLTAKIKEKISNRADILDI